MLYHEEAVDQETSAREVFGSILASWLPELFSAVPAQAWTIDRETIYWDLLEPLLPGFLSAVT